MAPQASTRSSAPPPPTHRTVAVALVVVVHLCLLQFTSAFLSHAPNNPTTTARATRPSSTWAPHHAPISSLSAALGFDETKRAADINPVEVLSARLGEALQQAQDRLANKQPLKHRVVVIGGGTGGVGVASQLKNKGVEDIVIIEPTTKHFYQPMWTLVGGGMKSPSQSFKPMKEAIPRGVQWIQASVKGFDPDTNSIRLTDGRRVVYDYLVVSAGMQNDWERIKGLKGNLGKNGLVSIYDFNASAATFQAITNFKGGRAIFTRPGTEVKCAGAAQKIMWITEDYVRSKGLRDQTEVSLAVPQGRFFGIKKYNDYLTERAKERGINALWGHLLIEVDAKARMATFLKKDGSKVKLSYDLLHVVPPMSSPDFIKKSPLANKQGWVDVDPGTLQSNRYSNVFSVGDCSSAPTSKTMAAITSQAPVVVHNLLKHASGQPLNAKYEGYSSCPIVVDYKSVLLTEFKYDGQLAESFNIPLLLDQGKAQWFFMLVKQFMFPIIYFELFLRGYWYGPNLIFPPRYD